MVNRKILNLMLLVALVASPLLGGGGQVRAQTQQPPPSNGNGSTQPNQGPLTPDDIGQGNGQANGQMRRTTQAQRQAAASHLVQPPKGVSQNYAGLNPATEALSPLSSKSNNLATMAAPNAAPDYFGVANWANSPLPGINASGVITPGTGIRKFVDTLPGLTAAGINDLGQYIPVAVADTTTFPESDYYEIGLVQYQEKLHADLPPTLLRGYVQLETSVVTGLHIALSNAPSPNGTGGGPILVNGSQVYGVDKPHYLGPLILSQRNRPVRVKFSNFLSTGAGGDLFIPTDTTYMGAGMGPGGSLKDITITSGGAGYTSAPTVVFNNTGTGGSGAAATATVINGAVVDVLITNGGSGYTLSPAVSFSGGGSTTAATATAVLAGQPGELYTQNRATLHLHGGNTPWVSDGTPHQWTTPAGEITAYSKGASAAYVPDMWFDASGNLIPSCAGQTTCAVSGAKTDPGLGSLTFFWTNQQSGRLMFYHDHAYGITRLNVYAGEAAGYLLVDQAQEDALAAVNVPGTLGTTPDLAHLVPLVIQDKTFVPDSGVVGGQLAATDPTWDVTKYGGLGNLWFPHVYMPNQNPADVTGSNAYGRWDYGPWFWPPQDPSTFVPGGLPYQCTSSFYSPPNPPPAFPPLMCPGFPTPSGVPEGFMDTPVINGTAYPSLTVNPTAYRFQILMAGNDRTWNLGLYVAEPLSVALTSGGSGYTTAPTVGFTGGGGSGATATATVSIGEVTGILITDVGTGYASAPTVSFTGGGGTGAIASATIDAYGHLAGVKLSNGGSGYTSAPSVVFSGGTPTTPAAATATITPPGVVLSVTVTNPGSGWTSAPTVTFTGGGGTGAAAIASINSEVKMVDAVPHTATSTLPLCSIANDTSGAQLVLGLLDANGNPLNGTGLPANCYPSAWPTDGRDGGVPDPLTAGPPIIQIGTEGGLLPSPVVIPSTPVGFEYFRRSITVLNIFTHGFLLGPAERADIVVDFSQYAGKTLILYNDAPAPVPAFDPRADYYTGDPDQTSSGGAPTTLPGYGPNTRTILQIKVNAAAGTPLNLGPLQTALPGIFATTQEKIIVPEPAYPVANGGAAQPTYARIQDTSVTTWIGGQIGSLTLTNGGSGYASAPTVSITGGGGTSATAAFTFIGATVNSLTLTNNGAGYTSAPTVVFNNTGTGGTGAAATAIFTRIVNNIAITNGGSGYASAPAVTIAAPPPGGVRATAVSTISGGIVTAITIVNPGSGYGTTAPTVTIAAPPPGGVRARATSTVTGIVQRLIITNGGSGYIAAPTVSFSGGGTPTTPAAAIATYLPGTVTNLILTNGGNGYTSAPSVTFSGGGTPTVPAAAIANPPVTQFKPKAIQELFTLDYGRMNATLGVEIPFTNFFVQTTIPYGYVDPPTEMFKDGETQIWKITHNGVDTHFIHFHLFTVQVINRVGWDGMIKPPDANELSWKDTVRMNPLEDIIVALRPMKQTLPWELPNSVRPLDVTESIGASNPNNTFGFANIDPTNQPAAVTNDLTNFGWEYVWHCHILGHEENDMMRAMVLAIPPLAPSGVTATRVGAGGNQRVVVTWMDMSINETGFTVQRATSLTGPWLSLTPAAPASPGTGATLSYTDTTVARRTTYYYRVIANNVVGYTQTYAAPAVGYPNLSADSAPVSAAAPVTILFAPAQEAPIFANSFETGLAPWSGVIGSVEVITQAVMGPQGGELGMAAAIGNGALPTYVYDTTPNSVANYDANFYFNPNGAKSDDSPIDIFIGLDQNGQPTFGVQFQTEGADLYEIRGWVMQNGEPVYTQWFAINNEPTKIDVAWKSGASVGFSLYIDDNLFATLTGDTSAYQLSEVLLGPSMGQTASASGTLYFDEFTSSQLNGVQYNIFLTAISR